MSPPLPAPGAPQVVIRECPRCRVPTYGDATPVHAPLCELVERLEGDVGELRGELETLRRMVVTDRTVYR